MRTVTEILSSETDWTFQGIEKFAKKNQVLSKTLDCLVLLNYVDDIPNEAWNDFNRQCRGVIIDTRSRTTVAHPYDKFFNLNSHPETKFENLPLGSGSRPLS